MAPFALLLAAAVSLPPEAGPALRNWPAPAYWSPRPTTGSARTAGGATEPQAIPTSPLVLVGIAPCRVIDTRGTAGVPYNTGGKLSAGESRAYDLSSAPAPCDGIPAGAEAFSVNITATEPEGPGFLSAFPTGPVPNPLTSILNYATGENVANATVVPADANGSITILTSTRTHVVVDVNGYYASLSASGIGSGTIDLIGVPYLLTSGGTPLLTLTGGAGSESLYLGLLAGNSTFAQDNTALGTRALQFVTGWNNTAVGSRALTANSSGDRNSALGTEALFWNSTGTGNSAFGYQACFKCQSNFNAAFGYQALLQNLSGYWNAAFGGFTLESNSSGTKNAAFGYHSLDAVTTGTENVAIGAFAGGVVTSGDNDIYVGSYVSATTAGESNTIRIGRSTHTATYVGGISGQTSASGVNVLVNSSGKLGTTTSSRRYKTEIEDVGERSEVLGKLRPVTFLYREELDPDRVRQYGLIAEEVAEVAPDLVVNGEDGRPQTVRYHLLVPLLLDALQKQQRLSAAQAAELAGQRARADAQQREIEELRREIATRRDLRPAD